MRSRGGGSSQSACLSHFYSCSHPEGGDQAVLGRGAAASASERRMSAAGARRGRPCAGPVALVLERGGAGEEEEERARRGPRVVLEDHLPRGDRRRGADRRRGGGPGSTCSPMRSAAPCGARGGWRGGGGAECDGQFPIVRCCAQRAPAR